MLENEGAYTWWSPLKMARDIKKKETIGLPFLWPYHHHTSTLSIIFYFCFISILFSLPDVSSETFTPRRTHRAAHRNPPRLVARPISSISTLSFYIILYRIQAGRACENIYGISYVGERQCLSHILFKKKKKLPSLSHGIEAPADVV